MTARESRNSESEKFVRFLAPPAGSGSTTPNIRGSFSSMSLSSLASRGSSEGTSDQSVEDMGLKKLALPLLALRRRSSVMMSAKEHKLNTWAEIWRELTAKEVRKLRAAFDQGASSEGLSLNEFIIAARQAVDYLRRLGTNDSVPPERVVEQLTELFERIDVNADGTMKWEEFTAFLVDNYNQVFEETADVTRYQRTPNVVQKPIVQQEEKVVYINEMSKYVACCADGHISVIDPWNFHVVKKWQGHKAVVLDAAYNSALNWIITTAADRTICAWDSISLSKVKLWRTPVPQTTVAFAHATKRVYTGGIDGHIRAFEIDGLKNVFALDLPSKPIHTKWVTDLLEIPNLGMLLSASMDALVHMMDVETMQVLHTLHEHTKGVSVLDYSKTFRASLSAGYDRDIIMWNPYVRSIFYRLVGHQQPVTGLHAADGSPEVISCDTSGRIKIWDIRTLQCLQTLEARDFKFNAMAIDPTSHEIFVSGKEWRVWKSVTGNNTDITSKLAIKDVLFNPQHNTWLVMAGNEITLWSAIDAHMLAHFEDITDSDVSAVLINQTGRQIVFAQTNGIISLRHSTTNGVLIEKEVLDDVAFLFFSKNYDLIAGSSKGRFIVIPTVPECKLIPTDHFQTRMPEVTCAHYSKTHHCVAVGGGKRIDMFSVHTCLLLARADTDLFVCSMLFCEKINSLLAVSDNGVFTFYSTNKLHALVRVHTGIAYQLSFLAFHEEERRLVTEGEQDGQAFIWDVSGIIEEYYAQMDEARGRKRNSSSASRVSSLQETDRDSSDGGWDFETDEDLTFLTRFPGRGRSVSIMSRYSADMDAANDMNRKLGEFPERATKDTLKVIQDGKKYRICDIAVANDPISVIRTLESPPCIIVGTMTGLVDLFALDGSYLGRLSQARNSEYKFHVDLRAFNSEKHRSLEKTMNEIATEWRAAAHNKLPEEIEEPVSSAVATRKVSALSKLLPVTDYTHAARQHRDLDVFVPEPRSQVKKHVMSRAKQLVEDARAKAFRRHMKSDEEAVQSVMQALVNRITTRRTKETAAISRRLTISNAALMGRVASRAAMSKGSSAALTANPSSANLLGRSGAVSAEPRLERIQKESYQTLRRARDDEDTLRFLRARPNRPPVQPKPLGPARAPYPEPFHISWMKEQGIEFHRETIPEAARLPPVPRRPTSRKSAMRQPAEAGSPPSDSPTEDAVAAITSKTSPPGATTLQLPVTAIQPPTAVSTARSDHSHDGAAAHEQRDRLSPVPLSPGAGRLSPELRRTSPRSDDSSGRLSPSRHISPGRKSIVATLVSAGRRQSDELMLSTELPSTFARRVQAPGSVARTGFLYSAPQQSLLSAFESAESDADQASHTLAAPFLQVTRASTYRMV